MKKLFFLVVVPFLFCCNASEKKIASEAIKVTTEADTFTIVLGSCSDQDRPQPLWSPIIQQDPDLFIWAGDNIYSDTDNLTKMEADYAKVWANKEYQTLAARTEISGTWDDHDYGKNDAGKEWAIKEGAQQLFLDFLKVPATDERRERRGVYNAQVFTTGAGTLKVISLDTRYFRDSLKTSKDPDRRYDAWEVGQGGTILGAEQWRWLEQELSDATPDFTFIVSSIQFLSDQHGWEKWANHPSEVQKMNSVLQHAKANNIVILSEDRHHAEISRAPVPGLSYPLIDFTSSGMTHTWPGTPMEENRYRVFKGTKELNFGVLKIDFEKAEITFEIRGEDDVLYERYVQSYNL